MGVHPFVLAAMRGEPVAVEDAPEPLTDEERNMLQFIEQADRYRRGEPHELTPEQLTEVQLAEADARELVEEFVSAGPDANPRAIVDEFIEAHGGHVLG